MRRFFGWGRQDPLCPAEAASPPPLLSAFHSPCPGTVLPSPHHLPLSSSNLFSDIERQLSAKLVADPLQIRTATAEGQRPQLQQPSPPTGTTSCQSSPVEPPTSAPPTPATNTTVGVTVGSCAADAVAAQPIVATTNNLLAVAAVAAVAAQQQQQQQSPTTTATTAAVAAQQLVSTNGPPQQQKGIDAFLAALATATSNGNDGQQQQQRLQTLGPDAQQQQPSSVTVDNNPHGQQAKLELGSQPGQPPPQSQQQQTTLAQSIQQAANNALAANLFVNALAAQRQQRQTGTGPTANPEPNPMALGVLQLQPQQQNVVCPSGNQSSNNNFATETLNALQLVQQTTAQLQCQQQQLVAEQQQQTAAKSPLSPVGIIGGQSTTEGLPALLNRLTVPNILRSAGPGPSQSKPIPLLNERVNLLQFKRREPREWSSDDVVAWILDVARRHQIPCENLNLTKFATCTGPLLMLMNEQSFKEHDPSYGSLLFAEFCKLVTDETFIDEWMRANATVAGPSSAIQPMGSQISPGGSQKQHQQLQSAPSALIQQTAHNLLGQLAIQQEKQQQQRLVAECAPGPSSAATVASGNLLLSAAVVAQQQRQQAQGQQSCLPPLNQLLLPAAASGLLLQQRVPAPQCPQPSGGSSAISSLSRMLHPMHRQQGSSATAVLNHPAARTLIMAQQQQQRMQMIKPTTSGQQQGARGVGRPPGSKTKVEKQIRRNKDGRPRKRSQHTKGNKLWEFIRDALKDPRTCPSVVRWEDPAEGVFRIVESERLAFLWGQKKNNQKMTYEKLSRAMRTYYEKEILVPVPKSGLYPKKLVYKFGSSAHGWRMAASLAVQAHLASANGPSLAL